MQREKKSRNRGRKEGSRSRRALLRENFPDGTDKRTLRAKVFRK